MYALAGFFANEEILRCYNMKHNSIDYCAAIEISVPHFATRPRAIWCEWTLLHGISHYPMRPNVTAQVQL